MGVPFRFDGGTRAGGNRHAEGANWLYVVGRFRQRYFFNRGDRYVENASAVPTYPVRALKGALIMKFILMMNTMKAGTDSMGSWPKEDIQAHIAFMIGFSKELSASGTLLSAE